MDNNMDVKVGNDIMDLAAGTTTIAALAGWLPSVAALFTILYTFIRIWESDTVVGWRGTISSWFAKK
jgi:hypothetical protein